MACDSLALTYSVQTYNVRKIEFILEIKLK